jgi:hypothetical protein
MLGETHCLQCVLINYVTDKRTSTRIEETKNDKNRRFDFGVVYHCKYE